jgi:hypothetical protein
MTFSLKRKWSEVWSYETFTWFLNRMNIGLDQGCFCHKISTSRETVMMWFFGDDVFIVFSSVL